MTGRSFLLSDESATIRLGLSIGSTMLQHGLFPPVLLKGPLGAGKTCIAKGIVKSLPGSKDAEVSSPSFNILNIYPTKPPTAHFDLYRLEGAYLDPESEDIILSNKMLVLIEWSEYLPPEIVFKDALNIIFRSLDPGRTVVIESTSPLVSYIESLTG
ncbi:tRNA (adenosine(37)-N6)-threonylcarbamoyltransferase complex ATPase subunit type 1 TsaE [Desulfonatronovibrio magnus]|uniref:tRNA (adenosine(37)-N6)-threonylcarbamoyltransferase complex ATPase subunit type 1 TsaE n=1 Tax=Desulfonatronovibrio magnus TaxID=698827 RepID=UPI0005EB179A|nr:tRNA (adenosine(37)-N6)-threonylcarbamoyltransferase complex ATPase subunit type 1 TsaE [Desulfonatronovibrio magnus]